MAFNIPHACTLPTADRHLRLVEFAALLDSLQAKTMRVA
jgi:hypothetical protein